MSRAPKTFVISEAIIHSHKCCICNHILSVPPIMSAGLENEMYKCGRCEEIKCQTYTRNRLFENVAQHLSFPCSYERCNKTIPWGRIEEHEKNCQHRTIKCPIYYHNCSEIIRVDQIEDHFTNKHKNNIRKVGETWTLNVGYDYVLLTKMDDCYFFIYILHLEDAFSVAVLSLERNNYDKFNLQLMSTDNEDVFSVSFKEKPIIRYNERSHCYMCIRKKCKELHHPLSEKNKTGVLNLNSFAHKIRKDLVNSAKASNGDVRYCIKLIQDSTSSTSNTTQQEGETGEVEIQEGEHITDNIPPQLNIEALRRGLSCPYCMTYMAAPIWTCSTGHTICNVCRPRLPKCPTCAAPYSESRNYTLEDLVKEVGVPCQYDNKGCTFMGNACKMYIHEQECSYSNLLTE